MSSGNMVGLYKNAPCILTCTRDSNITAGTPHGFGYYYWTINKSIQDSSISINSNYISFTDYRFVSVFIDLSDKIGCDGINGINIIGGEAPKYAHNLPIQESIVSSYERLTWYSYVWNGICRGVNQLLFKWTSESGYVVVDSVKIFVF